MTLRVAVALLCFALAWAMHFAWNSPLLESLFDDGYGDMALLLAVKGIPALIAVGIFWHAAARENGAHLHAQSAYLVPERDLIRDDEWVRLGAPMARYRVRRSLGRRFGLRARRLKAELQRAQLRLIRKAVAHGRGPRTLRHEAAVRRLRAELDALTGAQPEGAAS